MVNPKYDCRYLTVEQVMILRGLPERFMMFNEGVSLLRRGMIKAIDNHWNTITPRGQWAKRMIFHDTMVRVSPSHKHPWLHGKVGRVTAVHDWPPRANGRDEWARALGYTDHGTCVDVTFPDAAATHCFYVYDSLEAVFHTNQDREGHFLGRSQ